MDQQLIYIKNVPYVKQKNLWYNSSVDDDERIPDEIYCNYTECMFIIDITELLEMLNDEIR